MARLLYSDKDIWLMDDPLSAVDAAVGNHILNNAILGKSAEKTTRILVTHQLYALPHADMILVMESGKIINSVSRIPF